MLIYKQRNPMYYYVKKVDYKTKSTFIYSSCTSVIIDFNKPKAWIYIFYLV